MKFETHCHSHYSKGGKLPTEGLPSPKEIIRTAKAKGLKGIVLSDHDSSKGWAEAAEEAKKLGIIFIPSIEITTASGHLVAMGLNEYIPAGLPVEETIDRVHWQGGIAVASHPYDIKGDGMRDDCRHCDALESFNALNFDRFANRKARGKAKEFGLPTLAASDAHTLDMIATSYNSIPQAHDLDSFLREVKKGDTRKHEAYIPTPVLMDWVKGRFAGSYHHCMQHANRSYGPIKRRLATAMLRGYVKDHTRLRYVALAKLGLGLSRVVGAAKFVKGY